MMMLKYLETMIDPKRIPLIFYDANKFNIN